MIRWDDIGQYIGVFVALVISAFGFPIPEEIPIITAGVLVGKEWDNPDSWMTWWVMLPVLIAGVVVCDMILYFIGRKWGVRLLTKQWFQRHVLSPEKQERIKRNFHEYGIAILLVARVLPGIRSPIFIMSGVMKVPFKKFLIADGLYAVPGVNLLFWLSYWFTDQFLRAFQRVEGNRPIITAVILAAVAGFLLYKFLISRRVTTGDPEEIPVIGTKVASISHHLHVSHMQREQQETAGGDGAATEGPATPAAPPPAAGPPAEGSAPSPPA